MSVLTISRCDRWQVRQRLEDLHISCRCASDGNLHVDLTSPTTVVLVKSVLLQLTASRRELLDWLEYCWQCPTAPGD